MWLLIFGILIFCFGVVLLYGAPYVPVHSGPADDAVRLSGLKKGHNFYELGCGDGKMLILAAKTGANIIGYELNPIMFMIARFRTRKIKNVRVEYGNFWAKNLSDADVVYVFLLDRFMAKLDRKLSAELKKGALLISYTFAISGKEIYKNTNGLYLYRY